MERNGTAGRKKIRKRKFRISLKLEIPLMTIGVLLIMCPFIINTINEYRQSLLVANYREIMAKISTDESIVAGFENVVLAIPRIGVEVTVKEPPDTHSDYNSMLLHGPVFFRDSSNPGAAGYTSIGAHRVDHGSYFLDLDLLKKKDKIYLETPRHDFVYSVKNTLIVDINNKNDLLMFEKHPSTPQILLVSCEPKNTRLRTSLRIVVRGELETVVSKKK